MSAVIGHLHIDATSMRAAKLSLASVSAALEEVSGDIRDGLAERFPGIFVLSDDAGSLFRCEAIDIPATKTGEIHSLRVLPDERYGEFVTALAGCVDGYGVRVVHDWPVLSLVTGDTNVNGGAGESISRPVAAA